MVLIQKNRYALLRASDEIKNDKEVVLEFISGKLRNDEEIVRAAIQ